jgi:hypothetical protein
MDRQGNPPWEGAIPRNLDYLRVFAREMPYVALVGYVENGKEFKKRLMTGMGMMAENARGRPQMWITNTLPYNGQTCGPIFTIRRCLTVSNRPGMLWCMK